MLPYSWDLFTYNVYYNYIFLLTIKQILHACLGNTFPAMWDGYRKFVGVWDGSGKVKKNFLAVWGRGNPKMRSRSLETGKPGIPVFGNRNSCTCLGLTAVAIERK